MSYLSVSVLSFLSIVWGIKHSKAYCYDQQGKPSAKYLLVKYGGSAITNKQSFETINATALSSIASQVQEIVSQNSIKFVIVHGAGMENFYDSSRK